MSGHNTPDMAQSQPHKTTILLVDDHPLLRQALKDLLQKEADFEIVGEAGDGEEAVNIATQLLPELSDKSELEEACQEFYRIPAKEL